MNYFFLIICSVVLPALSLKSVTPKVCVNCKFFTKNVNSEDKYGRCSLFPKEENTINFLVSGIKDDNNYFLCSTARTNNNMCGKEGKMYKKNQYKKK
jgi:hypothetical protein